MPDPAVEHQIFVRDHRKHIFHQPVVEGAARRAGTQNFPVIHPQYNALCHRQHGDRERFVFPGGAGERLGKEVARV